MLRHVWVLKLTDEEAEVLGDPSALPVPEVLVTHGSRGATVYAAGRAERGAARSRSTPTRPAPATRFCVAYVARRSAGLAPAARGTARDGGRGRRPRRAAER